MLSLLLNCRCYTIDGRHDRQVKSLQFFHLPPQFASKMLQYLLIVVFIVFISILGGERIGWVIQTHPIHQNKLITWEKLLGTRRPLISAH